MAKGRRSERGLMLVDDPAETLRALCHVSTSVITWDSYKSKYEEIKGRTAKPVHEKTVDTHFYFLKILDLIRPEETESRGYRLSIIGKELCSILDRPDKAGQFRSLLSSILLENSDKGQLFSHFLEFVEKPRAMSEIREKFRTIPTKTLLPWTRLAGLIESQGDTFWRVHAEPHQLPTLEEFRKKFAEVYNMMQKTETFGVRRVFINVDELRAMVCYRLGGLTIKEFDGYLTRLLESAAGKEIRLHGAPTSVFADRRNFAYHGKLYAYLSMGV
jgi:NurA-like 5'-3' nuclease